MTRAISVGSALAIGAALVFAVLVFAGGLRVPVFLAVSLSSSVALVWMRANYGGFPFPDCQTGARSFDHWIMVS